MLIPASAKAGRLGDWKASKLSAFALVLRLPRIRREPKKIATSGTMALPSGRFAAAISTAETRFSLPSVRGAPIGSWLPVRITGFERFLSMKLRAEAV